MKDLTELDPQRLKWQCRRGMLELDLLLMKFLEERYPSLNEQQKLAFVKLLKESDQDLHGWFFGEMQPLETELMDIIKLIN